MSLLIEKNRGLCSLNKGPGLARATNTAELAAYRLLLAVGLRTRGDKSHIINYQS